MKLYKKLQILLFCCLAAVSLQAQCPTDPDGLVFTSQAAIDNFPINYPGCNNMPYNITILGGGTSNITDLSGLSQLTSIGGSLVITNNAALSDLSGLNSLTTVSGSLAILSNPGLTNVSALSSLTYANAIIVVLNNSLTSLSGLDGAAFSNGALYVSQNTQLSVCDIPNICSYLSNPANVASIFGNAAGCADRTEVEAACPPQLTCNSNVLYPVFGPTCQETIHVSDLLEGGPYVPNDYFLEIFVAPVSAPSVASGTGSVTVTSPYVGIPLIFRVTKTADGSFCEGELLLEDRKKPTPFCKNGIAASIPPAPVTISGSDLDAGSFDNCGAVTFTVSQDGVTFTPTSDFYCPGIFPVYLGVTDGAGNFDYCQTFIIVQDNFGVSDPPPPFVFCGSSLQFPLDANCQATINVFDLLEGGPYGADCYYFLEIFQGPGFTNLVVGGYGTIVIPSGYAGQTLIYQITNIDSGAQCGGTITLEDKIPPNLTCPADKIIAADENCQGLLESWPPATLSDNCSNVNSIIVTQTESPANFSAINDVLTVTLTAEDESGNTANCSFWVTLKDMTPPTLFCPADQNISSATCTAPIGDWTNVAVTDNCTFPPNITVSQSPASSTVLSGINASQAITLTADDGYGNMSSCTFTVTLVNTDADALMALYNATNGPNWNNNTGWGTDCNVCNWHGVQCWNDRVVSLDLRFNNLTGTLPAKLEDLTNIELLYLFNNNLSGTIPKEIGNLVNLKHLSLAGNQLTGTIPPEIGNLIKMIGLGFEGNQLTGGIPPEFKNLTNMQLLYLYSNQLSGTIQPEIGNLPNLNTLSLASNQFTGCFPATLNNLCNKIADFSNNPGLPGGGSNAAFQSFCATGNGGGVVINSVTMTDEACLGAADGSIHINATGHGGLLVYSIDGGNNFSFGNTFNNLVPGNYNIRVKTQGVTGCDAVSSAIIAAGPAPLTWYKDFDNDGYSDGLTQSSCIQPAGFNLPANLTATSGDCNDNDATQFPGQTWYKDQDNDGYSDGTTLVQCSKPANYKAASNLIATSGDCQDGTGSVTGHPSALKSNIYPTRSEVCNGIDDNCDGVIDENLGGLTFTGNVNITSQAQLNNWPACYTKITGSLSIQNSGINSLVPLANLTEVTGNVTVSSTALANLTGLNNLTTIGGTLLISTNNAGLKLSSLTGLEGLTSVGGSLMIYYNFSLTDCCPIEALLLNNGVVGAKIIFFNAANCASVSQVLSTCPLFQGGGGSNLITNTCLDCPAAAISTETRFSVFPNPTTGHITLRMEGSSPDTVKKLQVIDLWGRVLQTDSIQQGTKEQRFELMDLPAGVYFVKVLDGDRQLWVSRIVKQ